MAINRYKLSENVEQKYTPIVQKFIEELEAVDLENAKDLLEKDFSDLEINPYTLGTILEKLGYEEENRNDNGWQLDFWITYTKTNYRSIAISGCGITFELKLSEVENY